MRLLLINANTTESMTDRMVERSRERLPADFEVSGVTARFGAPYIASREASAIAAHAVVELCRSLGSDRAMPDAVVLACFGDPGLWAARDILPVPVIGMAEAACHTACQIGRRFSIITGGAAWVDMLQEFVAQVGLRDRLGEIRAAEFTGASVAADPQGHAERVLEIVLETLQGDRSDVVILGGAGFIGVRDAIAAKVPVPLLDSLDCALAQARALGALPVRPG